MRNKENIEELLSYLQTTENKELKFDKEAIIATYQKNNDNQSLAIKIASVFGGVLASLAFLSSLFIAGLYDSDIGLLIFGGFCIAGAIWINKKYDKIIMDTLSVSAFVIGFVLFGFGLLKLQMTENTISFVFILVALVSLYITQAYILSFFSVLIISGSIYVLTYDYYFIYTSIYISVLILILTYIFLKEAKIITASKTFSKLYNPVRAGLVFSFFLGLVFLNGWEKVLFVSANYNWLPSVVIIATMIYLLPSLFNILNINKIKYKISVYAFSIFLLLPTALSPAIPGAILIILMSFLVNYKTGLTIGIIAFIYFISQYYYDLNITLLTKSIFLFSSGVLFIAFYLFIHKKMISQ